MKSIRILAAGALAFGMTVSMASCSSKGEKTADSDTVVQVEEVVTTTVPTDSVAAIFADPSKASEVATDSTYATTPSGLKYMMIKEGTGKSPKATDNVTVHYEGKLVNGTIFDSSYERGETIAFPLNRVIPGWTEGLQLMKEGGKAIFYIPSNLGYGERGAGAQIPPNSDLVFTVELFEVN